MNLPEPNVGLDRHALVTALWLSFGIISIALFDYGFGAGGAWATAAGFAVIVAGFAVHIIVNVVYDTGFSPRELALGLVAFAAGLVAFVLAILVVPGFAERNFAVLSIGFVAIFVAGIFYMVTHYGVRRVFDAFDVVRDFRPGGRSGRDP